MIEPKDKEFKDMDTMTLDLDDGTTMECIVVTNLIVEEKEYVALLPMQADGSVAQDADVFLYRFIDLGNDEIALENIEDDEEFEKVSDAYDEMLDDAEFEELFDQ